MDNKMTEMNIKTEAKISDLETELSVIQADRLSLYKGNLLVDLIDKLYASSGRHLPIGAGSDQLHSTTRYVQAAEKIDKQNLRDAGLSPKYYRALQLFPKVVIQDSVSESKNNMTAVQSIPKRPGP